MNVLVLRRLLTFAGGVSLLVYSIESHKSAGDSRPSLVQCRRGHASSAWWTRLGSEVMIKNV